ncbi:MAG: ferrochelatase, partial [Candidatus Xenobia bacterium]
LEETARLVAEQVGARSFEFAWQSRSGPPNQPWLEPDILDALTAMHQRGVDNVVLAPIGFISDHMEVVYDLDVEAQAHCEKLGMRMARAGTPGTHPAFVSVIRELVEERLNGRPADVCAPDCCRYR